MALGGFCVVCHVALSISVVSLNSSMSSLSMSPFTPESRVSRDHPRRRKHKANLPSTNSSLKFLLGTPPRDYDVFEPFPLSSCCKRAIARLWVGRADVSPIFARPCERVFRVLRSRSLYRTIHLGSVALLHGKTLQGHLVQRTVNSFLSRLHHQHLSPCAAISCLQFYAPPWNATLFRARDDCSVAPALERCGLVRLGLVWLGIAWRAYVVCRVSAMPSLFNVSIRTCSVRLAISESAFVPRTAILLCIGSILSCTCLSEPLSGIDTFSEWRYIGD